MKLDGLRMAKGIKTGGRQKGSVNKKTAEVQAAVEATGVTPLEYMLSVMRSEAPNTDDAVVLMRHIEVRMDAAKAAAPYVHAKLAAITLSGDGDNPIKTVNRVELVAMRADSKG